MPAALFPASADPRRRGWRMLLEDIGIAVVLETRHGGRADIEAGGPGFGAMPVWRWNGGAYQRQAPVQ